MSSLSLQLPLRSRAACIAWLGSLVLAALPVQTSAQSWSVDQVETRMSASGQPVQVAVAVHAAASGPPRQVLIYPQPAGAPVLKVSTGSVPLSLAGPWMRNARAFAERGVALVYVDVPSDAAGRVLGARPAGEVRRDLQAVVDVLHKRYPDVPLGLATFAATESVLEAALKLDGVSRVMVASGVFTMARTVELRASKMPVLLVHAPGGQCDAAPYLEAEDFARRHHFAFVQAGYAKPEVAFNCGRNSAHTLSGLDADFVDLAVNWFDGKEVPANVGTASPQVAWREHIVQYKAPAALGMSNLLEMTLLLPDGPGPFPVLVFNHGDVDSDTAPVRHKARLREMFVAREFLRLGLAVAMPSRRGVGLSEGHYPRFSALDGDAVYMARVHAEDVLPALAYLRERPDIDATRIVLAGQSAGGFITMYLAGLKLPGVIGAIDFSGGRTDMPTDGQAGYLNKMMVSGFAELGASIRVPTLWVFAENDSRYTAQTIRASFEAFKAAGAPGRLFLNPPIAGDGHFIYTKPELWRDELKSFLLEIGAARGPV